MMPDLWRMSRKDGKATLVKSTQKKETFVLSIEPELVRPSIKVAQACPVNIIKVNE
jgi:ferredoxin